MNIFKKVSLLTCCSGLIAGTLSFNLTSVSAETINSNDVNDVEQEMEDTYLEGFLLEESVFNTENDAYKILLGIEALPPGIEKQGAKKIAQWLSNKTGVEVIAEGEYLTFPTIENEEILYENAGISTFSVIGWANCIGVAGMAAFSNALPIAKVLKIKSTFKALGGVTQAVSDIHTNFKYHRSKGRSVKNSLDRAISDIVNKKKLGTDAKQALLEFFGVSAVIGACGSLFTYEFNEDALKTYSA